MEIMANIFLGFVNVINIYSLIAILAGVSVGVIVGCLPGLTGTMAVAIMTPLTFTMAPDVGIMMLLGVYVGSIYGGSISAILIGTPGTPSSIVTVFDGHMMAKRGEPGKALYAALLFSTLGGLFSAACLLAIAPPLSFVALQFGPREYFGLTVFGLSVISSISGKNILKGFIMGIFGMTLSIIGIDFMSGVSRLNFGLSQLMGGLDLMPVLIGFFAAAEVFDMGRGIAENKVPVKISIGKLFYRLREFKGTFATFWRSSVIGVFIGIIPGAGGPIASFLAYDVAKKASKTPEKFGTGHLEGIVASETANNATTGGALIPMMTLGIPGDSVTAVLIGSFMIQGLQPGPLLFKDNPVVVYTLIAGFLIANIAMYGVGFLGINLFSKISHVSPKIIAPSVMILCMVGTFAVRNSFFDVGVMLVMGVLGFICKKHDYPGGPFIIGFILGPICEKALRQSLMSSDGDWSTFLGSPIAMSFILITIITLVYPLIRKRIRSARAA